MTQPVVKMGTNKNTYYNHIGVYAQNVDSTMFHNQGKCA